MSSPQFNNGQQVIVTIDHNHIQASESIIYSIGAINRVQGIDTAQLLQDGRCVGAVPSSKLVGR